METQIDGCPNSAVRISDALVIIPANWAGCSGQTLGYQLPFKHIAKTAAALHLGSIPIGDIQEEILSQDRRLATDTRYLFTPGNIELN